jgi:hypothetical protein
LWEEYAGRFIKFNTERKDSGPLIVMLAYCKIKEEGYTLIYLTHTNFMYTTHIKQMAFISFNLL